MTPELLFGAVLVVALSLGALARLLPKPRPKETHFRCARCKALAPHTERTIEAWRQKKTKFFCQACHRKWLETQSDQDRDAGAPMTQRRGSGCMGAVAVVVIVPAALFWSLSVIGLL